MFEEGDIFKKYITFSVRYVFVIYCLSPLAIFASGKITVYGFIALTQMKH